MCDEDELESGPYCIHWYEPGDCDYLCICGHKCGYHSVIVEGECLDDDCKCEQFEDADPKEREARGLPVLKKEKQ